MSGKYFLTINKSIENTSHGIILNGIEEGSTVLECGSSSGYMTRYMKEELHADVYIVELNKDDFKEAIQYADDGICANLEDITWIQYFLGKKFDYIIFADVLEHLRNPQMVLENTISLLKDDGTVITSIPNIAHHDILINLLNSNWNYTALGLLDNTHIHFWAEKNLEQFFTKAGLSIVIKDYCIIPAFNTEQKTIDIDETLLPAIDVICKRNYGDVYQFVFFSQKTEFVEKHGIMCLDNYLQRHKDYDVFPTCCKEYNENINQKEILLKNMALSTEKQAGIIEEQASVIKEQIYTNGKLSDDLRKTREQAELNLLAYEQITNSVSWRITKPFRMVVDIFFRLFNRLKST